MMKGVVDKIVIIANQSIFNSDHFKNRYTLDPIVNKAQHYHIDPSKVVGLDVRNMDILTVIHISLFRRMN